MEPPHSYVRTTSASVVHHADYLVRRESHALCGATLEDVATLAQLGDDDTICPDCEEKLVLYHLQWWREQALAANAELEALRAKHPESEVQEAVGETTEAAEPEPTTLLDHARRELVKLCREFDDAVPYFRLKNTMQAFSDRLESDERVRLAQQIGGDGTLIRWSTIEVVALGRQVSNSPVQGDAEATWDAWVQDPYPPPKKPKRRFGRS